MIICAAIQIQFERNGRQVETVICGLRHSNCWETMAVLGVPAQHAEVEGFIDDKNRFLDRYDAFAHALECGQLPETVRIHKADHRENQLYSEDLY